MAGQPEPCSLCSRPWERGVNRPVPGDVTRAANKLYEEVAHGTGTNKSATSGQPASGTRRKVAYQDRQAPDSQTIPRAETERPGDALDRARQRAGLLPDSQEAQVGSVLLPGFDSKIQFSPGSRSRSQGGRSAHAPRGAVARGLRPL